MYHTCVPEHYICMNLCACGRDDVDVYIYIHMCMCVWVCVCDNIVMYVCVYISVLMCFYALWWYMH